MSWIKRELGYLKDSFSQIIIGLILFLLASSGLISAIYLRFLNLNGTIISFVSILIEVVALVLAFLLVKRYIREKEAKKEENVNQKKIK